jgi:ArsR family transcriptional regulator, arsenate/arsenite/antimonite-responsive transcriptional repressor / arsenate reductase (thioredoxin)
MSAEVDSVQRPDVDDRVAKHAALADRARLAVVDLLALGDASPSELQALLGLPSNLLAHHLKVLEEAGIATRRRSHGDRRRSYVTLVPGALDALTAPLTTRPSPVAGARRVVFVCTANSARSQLATALWRDRSDLPVASAGTHPADRVTAGARSAAQRHGLRLVGDAPQRLDDVLAEGDLVVTVCDNAHEELGGRDAVHWAVGDPVAVGTDAAYDEAVADLGRRVTTLAGLAGTHPSPFSPDGPTPGADR